MKDKKILSESLYSEFRGDICDSMREKSKIIMKKVRYNIELAYSYLKDTGFMFDDFSNAYVRNSNIQKKINDLETAVSVKNKNQHTRR